MATFRGIVPLACGLVVLSGVVASWARSGPREDVEALKVVVHVNFQDSERQGQGLKNVANILKAGPDARVVVVCHGGGIGLVVSDQSGHGDRVGELVGAGVRFVACENTMRERSIRRDDLLPGVGTVPSGAVEVARRQQFGGYAYFKP